MEYFVVLHHVHVVGGVDHSVLRMPETVESCLDEVCEIVAIDDPSRPISFAFPTTFVEDPSRYDPFSSCRNCSLVEARCVGLGVLAWLDGIGPTAGWYGWCARAFASRGT